MAHYHTAGNEKRGPMDEATFVLRVKSGEVGAMEMAWRTGMADWEPVERFVEAHPQLGIDASVFSGAEPAPESPSPHAVPAAGVPVGPVGAATGGAAIPATSGKAIASLVCGILGILGCLCFTGIPAVICGHLALSDMRASPHVGGRGMAVAGLIMGYLAIAMSVFGASVGVAFDT